MTIFEGILKPAWMEDALCTKTGHPDDWFEGDDEFARSVCAACPVRAECLMFALEQHEVHGIWAGLSDRERKQLSKGERRTVIDETAILRRMGGDKEIRTTKAEKREIIRRLSRAGWSLNAIEKHTGINCDRYTKAEAAA